VDIRLCFETNKKGGFHQNLAPLAPLKLGALVTSTPTTPTMPSLSTRRNANLYPLTAKYTITRVNLKHKKWEHQRRFLTTHTPLLSHSSILSLSFTRGHLHYTTDVTH